MDMDFCGAPSLIQAASSAREPSQPSLVLALSNNMPSDLPPPDTLPVYDAQYINNSAVSGRAF